MQTRTMYPDRTLDGMMIGMRTMMTLGSVLSSPVVVGGVVYFGSGNALLDNGHLVDEIRRRADEALGGGAVKSVRIVVGGQRNRRSEG